MRSPAPVKSSALPGWSLPVFEWEAPASNGQLISESDIELGYAVLDLGGRFRLSFGDVAQFEVSFKEQRITLTGSQGTDDPASLDHLLYDHVLPRVISATGTLVLHGSAVEIDGQLAIFIGETGAGKSTLSASLHRKGHRLLGDDAVMVTCVDGAFMGEAVYPSLRLYPNSIEQVMGTDVPTAPMAHYSDKRHVTGFGAGASMDGPRPIGHLFFLGGEYHEPCLETIPLRDVCMALVEQSFALDPDDIAAAGQRMRQASALAASVPATAIYYPHDYAVLPQVHSLIEQTMEGSLPRPLPTNQGSASR